MYYVYVHVHVCECVCLCAVDVGDWDGTIPSSISDSLHNNVQ